MYISFGKCQFVNLTKSLKAYLETVIHLTRIHSTAKFDVYLKFESIQLYEFANTSYLFI